ncbi:MAG: sugar phosphate isomerase/epimerase [Candidatus Latescibacteria bacterium]|nr:sugar phosphate isomerase/epimerase [Candidatus Latescibacterota bacterium]
MAGYRFKLGIYLPELRLPFDQALDQAREMGAEYVWLNNLPGEKPLTQLDDAEVDHLAEGLARRGLKPFLISAGVTFKQIHLCDLNLEDMEHHPAFRQDLDSLVRTMQIAVRLGVSVVSTFTFAWPGEYTAGKPTWPMRWLTRGGVIADVDMEKLVRAFSLVMEQAERHGVDVALSMMPWNYTNTTGNFRRLAEALGSRRLRVMWGPADNLNCGEWDVARAGFGNVRPYLHGLHLKDLRVIDGLRCKFEYCPLGQGDVDYTAILRQLREHQSEAVLSVATHFLPPSGSAQEAMRINFANLRALIRRAGVES